MARLVDKIKDIDNTKETLKLAVRIIDLWCLQGRDKSEHAEMIVIDDEGDKIHIIVRREQWKTWQLVLKQDTTYHMHNFQVVNNDGHYRLCLHPYKLIFTAATVVTEEHLPNIP